MAILLISIFLDVLHQHPFQPTRFQLPYCASFVSNTPFLCNHGLANISMRNIMNDISCRESELFMVLCAKGSISIIIMRPFFLKIAVVNWWLDVIYSAPKMQLIHLLVVVNNNVEILSTFHNIIVYFHNDS